MKTICNTHLDVYEAKFTVISFHVDCGCCHTSAAGVSSCHRLHIYSDLFTVWRFTVKFTGSLFKSCTSDNYRHCRWVCCYYRWEGNALFPCGEDAEYIYIRANVIKHSCIQQGVWRAECLALKEIFYKRITSSFYTQAFCWVNSKINTHGGDRVRDINAGSHFLSHWPTPGSFWVPDLPLHIYFVNSLGMSSLQGLLKLLKM